MKDFKVPVAVITFLVAQAGGMVWFLSGIQNRVQSLEGERLNNVEVTASENRRYIREVSCLLIISVTHGTTHTIKCG